LKKFKIKYEPDGFDEEGNKIPDIPIIYLVLETRRARGKGPAVIDTGFDGGVYPNYKVIQLLRGLKPVKTKRLEHPLYGYIPCEIYRVRASIADPTYEKIVPIGEVNIYTPTEPEYINEEVLVGREILNNLKIILNGKWAEICLCSQP